MAKNYSGDDVLFKRNSIGLFKNARDDSGNYRAARLNIAAVATGEYLGSSKPPVVETIYLGAGQSTVWTPQATYAAISGANSLNTILANKYKDIFLALISVDIST